MFLGLLFGLVTVWFWCLGAFVTGRWLWRVVSAAVPLLGAGGEGRRGGVRKHA